MGYKCNIIIPESYKEQFEAIINNEIKDRVFYIDDKNKDIWEWAEVVYNFVEEL